MHDQYPTISIVTPSYNQGEFLEETIQSVMCQGYQNIQYSIIDGGSTDQSVGIIQKYADRLTYWISEQDGGQYDAINKGFEKSTGEIMGWLNSDDKYPPWTLGVVAEIFKALPQVEWITTLYPLAIDESGQVISCYFLDGFTSDGFWGGEYIPGGPNFKGFIQQESTFWRRSLWERAGRRLDASLQYAGDFELWARFYRHADLYGVPIPLAAFRLHSRQKSLQHYDRYVSEARYIYRRYGGGYRGKLRSFLYGTMLPGLPVGVRTWASQNGLIAGKKRCQHTGRDGKWIAIQV